MESENIPQDQWNVFFNDLSNRFQGWGVTMEILSGELGDQRLAAGQPLVGISRDSGPSAGPFAGPATGAIIIMVGDETSLESHHIERPRSISLVSSRPGEQSDLQIEAEDGTTTLIHFQQHPELQPPGKGIQAQP